MKSATKCLVRFHYVTLLLLMYYIMEIIRFCIHYCIVIAIMFNISSARLTCPITQLILNEMFSPSFDPVLSRLLQHIVELGYILPLSFRRLLLQRTCATNRSSSSVILSSVAMDYERESSFSFCVRVSEYSEYHSQHSGKAIIQCATTGLFSYVHTLFYIYSHPNNKDHVSFQGRSKREDNPFLAVHRRTRRRTYY